MSYIDHAGTLHHLFNEESLQLLISSAHHLHYNKFLVVSWDIYDIQHHLSNYSWITICFLRIKSTNIADLSPTTLPGYYCTCAKFAYSFLTFLLPLPFKHDHLCMTTITKLFSLSLSLCSKPLVHKSVDGWRHHGIKKIIRNGHGYRQSHWVRLTVTVCILFCVQWESAWVL